VALPSVIRLAVLIYVIAIAAAAMDSGYMCISPSSVGLSIVAFSILHFALALGT